MTVIEQLELPDGWTCARLALDRDRCTTPSPDGKPVAASLEFVPDENDFPKEEGAGVWTAEGQ